MIVRICLVKTLVKEKKYNIFFYYYSYLVKNLFNKTQWDKTWTKEKRVQRNDILIN